jgi:hypothetical protein
MILMMHSINNKTNNNSNNNNNNNNLNYNKIQIIFKIQDR